MKPEKSRTITLTESELNLLVSGLIVFEREQLRLANLAQEDGSTLEAEARRLSASTGSQDAFNPEVIFRIQLAARTSAQEVNLMEAIANYLKAHQR